MAKSPNPKVPKAALYKMVSYKGVSGGDEKHTGLSAAREVGLMKKNYDLKRSDSLWVLIFIVESFRFCSFYLFYKNDLKME